MRYLAVFAHLLAMVYLESSGYAQEYVAFNATPPLQSIYDAEDHRLSSAPVFTTLNKLSQMSDLTAALTALGRIGDPKSVSQVLPFINHRQPSIRSTAAYALGLLGGPVAVATLTKAATSEIKTEVLGAILLSLGRAGGEPELTLIQSTLLRVKSDPVALADALEGIGLLLNKNSAAWVVPPDLLTLLAQHSADQGPSGPTSAFALTRYKGDVQKLPVTSIVSSFYKAKGAARALLARVLGKIKSEAALAGLMTVRSSTEAIGVRVETARALGNYPDAPQASQELRRFIKDVNTGVRLQALQSIAGLGIKGASLQTPVEQAFKQPSIVIKSQAIQTLAAIAPKTARPIATKLLKDNNPELVAAGLTTLGALGTAADLALVMPYIDHDSTMIAVAATSVFGATPKTNVPQTILASLRKALAKRDLALTATVAETAASLDLRDLAPDLAASYLTQEANDVEAKLSILIALGKIGSKDQLESIEGALKDDERLVVIAAAAAYKSITGEDVSANIPATSTIHSDLPPMADIARATKSAIVLHTTHGNIRIALFQEAPLVAYHFVTLVEQGFYNGLTFHRVVPNFVAQGGDPRGDGFGGPGYMVRDQVSAKHHLRGTLGMATAGKDTAGSQFFINLAPNFHLDGAYTVFGTVVSGMDVADKLEAGDAIIDAQVIRGFE